MHASIAITVLAAASLSDVLPKIAAEWNKRNKETVAFSFDGSSRLAKQIEAGIPADVFISADTDWMDHVEKAGKTVPGSRKNMLSNRLVLIVPKSAPKDASFAPRSPEGLSGAGLKHLALADENVPAGKYARAALRASGAWDGVKDRVVNGDNARAATAWVSRGEAEAGIVYATDATADAKVRATYTFPEKDHPKIVYPAALVKNGANSAAAKKFLEFLSDAKARAIFSEAGFTRP